MNADEFIEFFHRLIRRRDLYVIMQKYVDNREEQSMDQISMSVGELLEFLQNVQQVILRFSDLDYPE